MVKIVSMGMYAHGGEGVAHEVWTAYNVADVFFFKRNMVRESCRFLMRTIVGRTAVGGYRAVDRLDDVEKDGSTARGDTSEMVCHVFVRGDALACAVITDGEYPLRVAASLTRILMAKFDERHSEMNGFRVRNVQADVGMADAELDALMAKYQDPEEADAFLRIHRELEETKEIVMEALEKVIARGDKIEDLVERSRDLSTSTKSFARTARKANKRCCAVQ